jgi:hypothetical protein
MKLDRKEILKALEAITTSLEKEKYGRKRCHYKQYSLLEEVVVDLVLRCNMQKNGRRYQKNNS